MTEIEAVIYAVLNRELPPLKAAIAALETEVIELKKKLQPKPVEEPEIVVVDVERNDYITSE